VRGFLKQFAPDTFGPDEISILEGALTMLGDGSRTARLLGRSMIIPPLRAQSSPSTSLQWLRAASEIPSGYPTARFFTSRNKN
jgi:hypothetical protein